MALAIKLTVVAVVAASVFGDAAMGALIAGAFSVINTALLVRLRDDHRRIRRAMTAPRRLVYDAEGQPIGTVLELKSDDGWESWLQSNRRRDDPPTT